MAARFLRTTFRRLPPVSRRDDRIARLKRRLANRARVEEQSFEVPSFRRYVYAERRIGAHLRDIDPGDRGQVVTHKLKSYAFARSHGVAVPEIFGLWDRPADITWDELPDAVVIKSVRGRSARGVLPLRRSPGGWTPVTRATELTSAELAASLQAQEDADRIGGPYFAEELLGDGDGLPVDVKVHAFFGEISHVLLRRAAIHQDPRATAFRVILADGSDPGPVLRGLRHDHDIPVPSNLGALMEVASRLSRAIPRPFIRVDLYDVDGRIVFGELTPRPGHLMDYGPRLDEHIGHFWERAQARVLADALLGVGPAIQFGPGPRELIVDGQPYIPDGASAP